MQNPKEAIQKIGLFTYYFAHMDTLFIDKNENILWENGHNQLPESLQFFEERIVKQCMVAGRKEEADVLLHKSELQTNYLSAKVYHQHTNDFLGTMIVGPFLFEEPSAPLVQDVLFDNQLPISLKHTLTQYYLSLPLISEYRADMIAKFLAFHIAHIDELSHFRATIRKAASTKQPILEKFPSTVEKAAEMSPEEIEQRYSLQNKLLEAVENGDIVKAEKILNEEMPAMEKFPDRIPNDPLRSEKNLAFTFNTLLRIAVEKGGLHPVYIHSISEKFALQIEKTTSRQQLADLHPVMLREYCEAVRKLSLKNYSFFIRKAIEYIRLHLEQELNLETISHAIHCSTFELSRNFKKETGQSISEYINTLRINEALSLMENRKLSITDIAYMVGFNDVNYFTKVFKKQKGMTPSAYRKQL